MCGNKIRYRSAKSLPARNPGHRSVLYSDLLYFVLPVIDQGPAPPLEMERKAWRKSEPLEPGRKSSGENKFAQFAKWDPGTA